MYRVVRFFLFLLPAESAHKLTLLLLRLAAGCKCLPKHKIPIESTQVMGLEFPNPVGLAAGFDKNAEALDALSLLGFGFIEVGTVTPKPQPGNPKPRLFRLTKQQAIINRMGFNNKGVEYLVKQIEKSQYQGILGINIGKNKDTPPEQAPEDYLFCMRKVYSVASYIVVNLSSPNTPGLRALQFGQALDDLLHQLKEEQKNLTKEHDRHVPLVLKIAPDMGANEIKTLAQQVIHHQMDGVIATNTTIERIQIAGVKHANQIGGLSGKPLQAQSTRIVRLLAEALQGAVPIIAVGGISDAGHAHDKIIAGASLVQLYTGMVFQGPKLIEKAAQGASSALHGKQ